MSEAIVTLFDEVNLKVEYDYDITTHDCSSNGWDEPGWGAEFTVAVLSVTFSSGPPELELPKWLKLLIEEHLEQRADINEIVQLADQESGDSPDDERE